MDTKRTLVVAAALVVAACTQKENPVEERIPVALAYTTVQATETKAAQDLNEGTFVIGEAIKVRISNTGVNSWTDYTFTTAADGAMTAPSENPPYYPAGSQNIDIVAYYPATAGTSFTVADDQTEDDDYKASDLMFASVTNRAKQAEAVGLEFSHKMAKLNVNVTAGTGVGSISSVSILNVLPTVEFDPVTGEVGEASGTATDIAVSNEGAALIPAQTINGGLLSIVTAKGTATYTVSNKVFAAGQQYTLNITVNLRAVGTTNAITGWTGEGTVTVDSERLNIAGHEYVEMGDGLKWATCNLGASAPWERGDYYAWGAIVPFHMAGYADESPCTHWIDGKSGYNWASCPFMQPGQASAMYITKYYEDVDDKTTFSDYDYVDDAARQRWGGTWRIPTDDEWAALRDTDNYSWVTVEDYLGTGMNGKLVTRLNGPFEGNSIFLPAVGYRHDDSLSGGHSYYGYYWSSTLRPGLSKIAYYMRFDYSRATQSDENRNCGLSIRPVAE